MAAVVVIMRISTLGIVLERLGSKVQKLGFESQPHKSPSCINKLVELLNSASISPSVKWIYQYY